MRIEKSPQCLSESPTAVESSITVKAAVVDYNGPLLQFVSYLFS